jgi:hypothetical protein
VAARYHTARFRLVPALAKALNMSTPPIRKPGTLSRHIRPIFPEFYGAPYRSAGGLTNRRPWTATEVRALVLCISAGAFAGAISAGAQALPSWAWSRLR